MSLLADTLGWYADWAWGLPLIVLTVVIHVSCLLLTIQKLERVQNALAGRYSSDVVSVMIVGAMALLAASLHGIEAMIWAAAYRLIGALPDFNSAVLYSLSAMTSYGHADLVLEKRWQLLGALEALNGPLLFGLTTAFLIGIIQRARLLQKERSP
jgi:hypothetical protein